MSRNYRPVAHEYIYVKSMAYETTKPFLPASGQWSDHGEWGPESSHHKSLKLNFDINKS